ncbi:MAG: carboxypeptidase-like regulatory domain-containing protein [Desulfobulbaceae bacterium]
MVMPKNGLLFLWLLLSWLAAYPPGVLALQIEGVVLSEKGPVADAEVTAYPDYTSLRTQQNGLHSTPGEKTGQYRLTVPPGKYYLVAHGTDQGVLLSGYHGLNPLQVDDEYQWIPLIALPRYPARCQPGPPGVEGRLLYKGRPAANSSISVYALKDEPFRGMGLLTNTVPEDGTFRFDLDPGSYVLIARKRIAGGAIGPIRKGDLFCYFSDNPLQIPPDQSCTIDIACYPRDDLNAFLTLDATDPRGEKEPGRRAASLKETDETGSIRLLGAERTMPAFISGRVTDLSGFPLEDLSISAYPADDVPLFQMYVLRLKTEQMTRTDAKGFFRLELRGGTYYLVARERVGDAPVAGEYYGIYEGTPNHSISLKPNEILTGVHIVAEPIMP